MKANGLKVFEFRSKIGSGSYIKKGRGILWFIPQKLIEDLHHEDLQIQGVNKASPLASKSSGGDNQIKSQ